MALLLRNGCVIDTEPQPTVHLRTDVLVDGDRIAAVGPDLPAGDADVIDATDPDPERRRVTAADVLRAATLDGAAALGLADRVGSLRPGKQADIVLLRANDLNLLAGRHDPIGTVVAAAHPGNVDTVLVAGRIVKRDGRLVHPDLPAVVDAAHRSARHVTETP